jgi:hypothetical protein
MLIEPASSSSCAIMTVFWAELHILVRVVHGTDFGKPAPKHRLARWRLAHTGHQAAADQGLIDVLDLDPACSTAALIATLPSCGAVRPANCPWKAPTGVRLAPTMTTDSLINTPLSNE